MAYYSRHHHPAPKKHSPPGGAFCIITGLGCRASCHAGATERMNPGTSEVAVKKIGSVRYYLSFFVALATFAIYLPALLQNQFVHWDDGGYIFANPHIRTFDLAFLKWAFFDFYVSTWHPLTWVSHALDYAVWGTNPIGHHLTSSILHAVNAFLVVLFVIKLLEVAKQAALKKTRPFEFLTERTIFIIGGTTGFLFGLHPLHVESVAWAAERKDVLCAVFFLLSIIAYVNSVKVRNVKNASPTAFFNKQYRWAVVFFVLALLSKPMAVTLPVVLLILDRYPFGRMRTVRDFWAALAEKLPFFVLSLITSVLTILAQSAGGSVASIERLPVSTRILVAAKALIAYLGQMVWPLNLFPLYQYPDHASLVSPEFLFPLLIAAGVTAAAGIALVKKPTWWAALWAYYLVTLLPVLGLVQVGRQPMADRYTYLPGLAPFFAAGLFAALIAEKAHMLKKYRSVAGIGSAAVGVLALAFLSYLTVQQTAIWENDITLWTHVVEKAPVPLRADDQPGKTALHDAALLGFGPAYDMAFYKRGLVFQNMGRLDRAKADYDAALAFNSRNAGAYNNRGVLLCDAGSFDAAIQDFSKTIDIEPQRADAFNNRGVAYFSARRYEKALEDFNTAVGLDGHYASGYLNRGKLYFTTGKKNLARADFQQACDLGDEDGCKALR
jgi:tetratricopeptide (TPR) repeat protein